jgi:hypothetical protein
VYPTPSSPPDNAADAVPVDHPDAMTVLFAIDIGSGVPVMAKTWVQSEQGVECRSYDNAAIYKVHMVSVATVAALAATLAELKGISRACVIRGRLRPHANPNRTPRWSCDQEDRQATFEECARGWLLLDFDGFQTTDFPSPVTDPHGCIALIRQRLPEELRGVACFWSFSNSTGMKPGKLGIHIFLLLPTPLGWRDSEAFMVACGADRAMARIVQVHYTAAPQFIAPLTDPLPVRFGVLPGVERVPADAVVALVEKGRQLIAMKKPERAAQRKPRSKPSKAAESASETKDKEAKETSEPVLKPETPPGKIGDDHRTEHLIKVAGFVRKRGLNVDGLRCVLSAENTSHFFPLLPKEKIEKMAVSFANYPVRRAFLPKPWTLAVEIAAGLDRHGATEETMIAAVNFLIHDEAKARRTVEALLALEKWERDCAESVPPFVLDEEKLS